MKRITAFTLCFALVYGLFFLIPFANGTALSGKSLPSDCCGSLSVDCCCRPAPNMSCDCSVEQEQPVSGFVFVHREAPQNPHHNCQVSYLPLRSYLVLHPSTVHLQMARVSDAKYLRTNMDTLCLHQAWLM